MSDSDKILNELDVNILGDLTYAEQPVRIVDTHITKLKNKEISIIKILWNHHNMEKCTWEIRESILK